VTWRLDAAARVAVRGRFWRMLAPRWAFDPLSGAGAARAGGRWNERGQAALYLSDSHATAIAEYQQDLPRPGTLTAYDVDASTILDLTAVATRRDLGMDDAFLRQPWKQARDVEGRRPSCWDLAASAAASGWQGLRVPSVQAPGTNLVLWRWNEDGGARVRHMDPLNDLTRDQTSWPTDEREMS
jgi:RES domain-containing protein